MIGISIQPSPWLLKLNFAIHLVLFIGFCMASPLPWFSVMAAFFFVYFYWQAQRHLQLKQRTSIQGILLGESGWRIKVCPTLTMVGASKDGWLPIEAPSETYLSRYFILLKVRDLQNQPFQQWLTPDMVGESEYRKLCRWLLAQQSEDKKPKPIPVL